MAAPATVTIHDSAKEGDIRTIMKWIDTEGDLDRKDVHDFTPLHWACKAGKKEITDALIKAGANINAQNCAGDKPIHYAASGGFLDIVTDLIDNGADVNAGNDHGNTPLHYACYWRHPEVAEYLISKGALISSSNKYGKTPLQRAGDALSSKLKEKAVSLGQSLAVTQVKVRSADEAAGLARAKFIAESGVQWHVKHGTISYEELLASPSPYFEVYKGEWSNYRVAIKKPINQEIPEDDIKLLESEVSDLRKLYHANIHSIIGGCIAPPNVCIFTELMPVGSLFQLLHDPEFNMDQRLALKFVMEVAKAIGYLHEQNPFIVHRNLKTPNILVTEDLTLKLTDYGFNHVFNSVTNRDRLYEPQWCAPEMLRERVLEDGKPADIYSFGIVFFEIVTRQVPFDGMNAMQIGTKIVLENMKPEIPGFVPKHLAQLMGLCWQDEPGRRPKMTQIIPILEKC